MIWEEVCIVRLIGGTKKGNTYSGKWDWMDDSVVGCIHVAGSELLSNHPNPAPLVCTIVD